MFTWICPQCGREVPPAYDECPDCAARQKQAATAVPAQAAAEPAAAPAPPVAAPAYVPPAQPYTAPVPAYAAPPRPAAAPRRPGLPTWLLSILFALAFIGLGAGVYWVVSNLRNGGAARQNAAPADLSAAHNNAKPHPLQKYIEVTGVRFVQDAKKKTEARFLIVNHSPDDIADLGGTVTIWGRTQKSDEESVGSFTFKLPDLGPWQSRELVAPVDTKLRVYELPDWQNVTAEVQLTSP